MLLSFQLSTGHRLTCGADIITHLLQLNIIQLLRFLVVRTGLEPVMVSISTLIKADTPLFEVHGRTYFNVSGRVPTRLLTNYINKSKVFFLIKQIGWEKLCVLFLMLFKPV